MTGDCDVQGDCVSSANYPDPHGPSEQCDISILRDTRVTVGATFSIETGFDHLMIGDLDVADSSQIPPTMSSGDSFTWTTDQSVQNDGWQLCFSEISDSVSDYFTMVGDCDIQGDCVSTNNYPGLHGNEESCSITMLQDASITVGDTFEVEACCDHLMIRGEDVESSDAVPRSLNAGETFTWTSDFSLQSEGWQLCFSEASDDDESKLSGKLFF